MTDFNLQTFLADMRHEQKADYAALCERVDAGFEKVAARAIAHELDDVKNQADTNLRLTGIEKVLTVAQWVVVTVVGTAIVGILGTAGKALAAAYLK